MSKKVVECPPYLYKIEFILKSFDIYDLEHESANDQKMLRFRMLPSVCIDINEDEYIDQVNCGKSVVKSCTFSMTDDQARKNLQATIIAYKFKCEKSSEIRNVGCYKVENLHCHFLDLKKDFNDKSEQNRNAKDMTKCATYESPAEKTLSEVAPLTNARSGEKAGTVFYGLRLTCFGPNLWQGNSENVQEIDSK